MYSLELLMMDGETVRNISRYFVDRFRGRIP